MKKATWVFACLILTCLLPVSATGTDVLLCGGFEANAANCWTARGGAYGTEVFIDGTDAVGGTQSLKISASGNVYAVQAVTLSPGYRYVLTGYMKADTQSGYAAVKVEYTTGALADKQIASGTENVWKPFTYTFVSPEAACNMSVLLRVIGGGTVWFDEVHLYRSGTLKNGSFTEGTSSQAANWYVFGGWGTYASVSAASYAGRGITITNTDSTKNPYISQSVSCESSATYTLSGYYKCTAQVSAGIKLEHYVGDDNTLGRNYSLSGGGSWKAFSFTFETDTDQTSFNVLLRLYGTGAVEFDEVSLVLNSAGQGIHIRVEPRDIFAYTDIPTGEAAITISQNTVENGSVEAAVLDGDAVLWQTTVPAANTVSVSYSNALLTETGKAYTLRARLFTAGGGQIAAASENIYRYPRPTRLSANGDFLSADGQPVQPVIAYHVPLADYGKMAEIGVSIVQCIYTSDNLTGVGRALDTAQANGLYAMIPLYANGKTAGSTENADKTAACISRFKDHPALYGWMVMDEPQPMYDEMYEELKASYKLIRDLDADHPIYICECNQASYGQSGKCCDVLCVDPYPKTRANIGNVYTMVNAAAKAVHGEKPVYNLVQAWKWTAWEPNASELRNMIYQGFLAGAKGYGFYPIRDADSTMHTLALWDGAASFAQYEKDALFAARANGTAVIEHGNGYDMLTFGDTVVLTETAGTGKTVSLPYSMLTKINGGGTVRQTESGLQVALAAWDAVMLTTSADTPSVTLWKGNTKAYTLKTGTYTVQKAGIEADAKIYAALYGTSNGVKKLIEIYDLSADNTLSLTVEEDTPHKLKLLCRRGQGRMQPLLKVWTLHTEV